jgi:hypothetical protein
VWSFNILTGQWTWLDGINQSLDGSDNWVNNNYGQVGVPSVSNVIRSGLPADWMDNDGSLWLVNSWFDGFAGNRVIRWK